MSLLYQQISSILYEADNSRIGIIVRFHFQDTEKLSLYQVTRFLYKVRKDLGLNHIQCRASPDSPDNEIWLFKTKPGDPRNKPELKVVDIGDIL